MNIKNRTANMVIIAVLTAILIIMAATPLGYLNIGLLSITFMMIPVAIGAIVLGPKQATFLGLVFGLTSLGQATGVLGSSGFGIWLFSINPLFTILLCIIPRTVDGFLIGLIAKVCDKKCKHRYFSYAITGFFAAFINTVIFMLMLVILFANELQEKGFWEQGKSAFGFMVVFAGVNAVVEAIVATIITATIGISLYKAKLIKKENA